MYTLEDYKKALNSCCNIKNFGCGCWEFCAYRENGMCELSENELMVLSLEKLGVDINKKDLNPFIELMNLALKDTKPKRKAIISGSYDPFTNGHLELVKQASLMFDEIHVVIFINSSKIRNFDVNDMVDAIDKTLKNEGILNAIVTFDDGLLAEYCKRNDITTTIRGLRNNLDYNYEENIVEVNKLLNKDLQTIYLRGNDNKISSSTVRELLKYNKDVSMYVPKEVLKILF